MRIFQQGDVVLKTIATFPAGDREIVERLVLADGEVTGHAHRIAVPAIGLEMEQKPEPVRLFRVNGVLYVEATSPFSVKHEEHHEIQVPAGKYEVNIVQEFDHFAEESRNVAD